MLHEQAQRARSKRPPDQLTIEAYRPSRCLSISYWHGLARTQYNSVMGLDGKLHATGMYEYMCLCFVYKDNVLIYRINTSKLIKQ